jgi:hypothetical protein
MGYLDSYGAGEERRNRIIIRSIVISLSIIVVSSFGWYLLKNHHQEALVKEFVQAVRRGDYQTAYRVWGCTPRSPCSGYDYDKFLGDWGSKGDAPDAKLVALTDSESCNNGVLLTVAVNKERTEKLWVQKGNDSISFAPYPICPHKNPWAIMLHRTIGKLRKPLLQ